MPSKIIKVPTLANKLPTTATEETRSSSQVLTWTMREITPTKGKSTPTIVGRCHLLSAVTKPHRKEKKIPPDSTSARPKRWQVRDTLRKEFKLLALSIWHPPPWIHRPKRWQVRDTLKAAIHGETSFRNLFQKQVSWNKFHVSDSTHTHEI